MEDGNVWAFHDLLMKLGKLHLGVTYMNFDILLGGNFS